MAKSIRRLPALSTGPVASSCRLQPFLPVIAARIRFALSQAAPSVAAMMGRTERLGIDGIDVAPARAHGERAGRSAAEEEERMRLLEGANIRSRAFDPIELPGEIERPLARPGELHQFEILRGAQIALAFRTEIT